MTITPPNLAKGALALALALVSLNAPEGALAAPLPSQITYFLDQSDRLLDGVNYLQVTISKKSDDPQTIAFDVTALQTLLDLSEDEEKFGIAKFSFNVVPGVPLTTGNVDISSFAPGWAKGANQPMATFGTYGMRLRITDAATPRLPTMHFEVQGVSFDSVFSYVALALGSTEGPSFFSARVEGLMLPDCPEGCIPGTAFFGGIVAGAVPAPPALWLLASGLASLVWRRWAVVRATVTKVSA